VERASKPNSVPRACANGRSFI